MKYKKIIFITLLLLFVLTINSVNATDNLTDNVVNFESYDENIINIETNNLINESEAISSDDSENMILTDSYGTFDELNTMIQGTDDGKTISLKKDYKAFSSNDRIILDKQITIDGKGFTINFNNLDADVIIKNQATIKNINFINSKNNGGVHIKNSYIYNCNFEKHTGFDDAVYCDGDYVEIFNSNFNYNSGDNGAALSSSCAKIKLVNCTFSNNIIESSSVDAEYLGGAAIDMGHSNAYIENCSFIKNKVKSKYNNKYIGGGAIFARWSNLTIQNSKFINNQVTSSNNKANGGAIHILEEVTVKISNSLFEENSAENSCGGSIYIKSTPNIEIDNCSFIDNNAKNGGAIYGNGNSKIKNCNFADNTAYLNGGAIYNDGSGSSTVDTCIFKTESDSTFQTLILPPTLNVDNFTTNYNSSAKITFDLKTNSGVPVENGNISISIYYKSNDNWFGNYSCLSSEGWTVDLPAGSYYATYNTEYAEFQPIYRIITVNKANSDLNIINEVNLNYGTSTNVTVTTQNATGIIAKINDENTAIEGNTIFIPILDAGAYNLTVTTITDANHNAITKTVRVIVKKNCSNVYIPDKVVNDNNVLSFDLPNDATGTMTLTIENKNYTTKIIEGKVNINLTNLKNGEYQYTITYSGDYQYSSFTKNGEININRPSIKSQDMVINFGNNYDFKAIFFDNDGSPLTNAYVIFKVKGNEYVVKTDTYGLAILKIGLNIGEYNITSINTKTDETKINNLTVKSNNSNPKPIDDKNIIISSLDGGSGSIKLPNDAMGTITLDISGKTYTFPVVNGVANVNLPNLANGNYEYIIIYSGDTKYASFTKTGSVIVNKQPTPTNPTDSNNPTKPLAKTTLTLKTVKVKKSAKKLVLQATLKQGNKALSGKKIIFKFNGKKYNAKTNKKGVAKVTIKKNILKKLKLGKKVKYQASYGEITVKKSVKIKK